MDVVVVVPGDLPGPSGGTHYNRAVTTALQSLGHAVDVRPVPGSWPRPTDADRDALLTAMRVSGHVLVDGIMALAAPEAVKEAVRDGAAVHVLVHSLLTADPELAPMERADFEMSERAALLAATSASCASQWSSRDVRERCSGVAVHAAEPGTDTAAVASGSTPPQLLVLAALTPLKNQATVLRALRDLVDLPWTLHLVGSAAINPGYADTLRALASDLPPGRVTFHGALAGPDLDDVWDATDLLLLTSTSETWGMVITEALARGIPAVVPAGTGAVEALVGSSDFPTGGHAGAIVDLRDGAALATVLRAWLTSPGLRDDWRAAALHRRSRLVPWTWTAQRLLEIIRP